MRDIWVYLSATPLLHLTLTLVAYQIGLFIHRAAGNAPLLNPVLIAVLLLAGMLLATDTSYATYFDGAQFVHFLLGPATVALAIPLYKQVAILKRSLSAILINLLTRLGHGRGLGCPAGKSTWRQCGDGDRAGTGNP